MWESMVFYGNLKKISILLNHTSSSLLNISTTRSSKKITSKKLWKVYKPDFVGKTPNDHSSRSIITNRFKRPTRTV